MVGRFLSYNVAAISLIAAMFISCGRDTSSSANVQRAPGDSARIREVEKFRTGLTPRSSLTGGAPTSDSLIHSFVRAVEQADTSALKRLAIDKAEFAYLYYPNSPMSRPPYDLDPDLMWSQISGQRERGLRRVLELYAGKRLNFVKAECTVQRQYGPMEFVKSCRVDHVSGKDTVAEGMFGSIIGFGGTYKFVGYGNRL